MTQKFATFDLEIAKEIPDGTTDWQPYAPLGVTCAAIATRDYGVERFYAWPAMSRADVDAYINRLQTLQSKDYLIVSVNGTAFDYRVLAQESSNYALCGRMAKLSADILLEVVFRKGHRLGLDAMLVGAGLTSKLHSVTLNDGSEITDFNGAKAPAMWAAKEFNAVLAYLDQDVLGLLNLCEWIEKNRCIKWTSKTGRAWTLPINRIRPVDELHKLPKPDTKWMENKNQGVQPNGLPWPPPPTREEFTEWINQPQPA